MNKEKNKNNEENGQWGETIKSLASGFFKKISFDLIVSMKEQWEKFLFRAKSNMIVLGLTLLGLIFVVTGLALLLENVFKNIPGVGFIIVGLVLLLIGWVINLVKKLINN